MDPFRIYRQVSPATARRSPSARCAVCCRRPAQLRQAFDEMAHRSWSPAEIDTLRKAAHSALL
jgi:hypothetical protein